jgi:hypothetical protein
MHSNQRIDGLVIEHAKHVLRAARRQAVIEGGDEIEEKQGGAIDAEGDYAAGIAILRRHYHQHHATCQCQRGAHQM